MPRFCGVCHGNLDQLSQQTLHPALGDGRVLCGSTSRVAPVLSGIAEPPPRDLTDVAVDAKREFEVVMEALAYHAAHEDTPVEVNTDGGWMDMADLLEPLSKLLGDD